MSAWASAASAAWRSLDEPTRHLLLDEAQGDLERARGRLAVHAEEAARADRVLVRLGGRALEVDDAAGHALAAQGEWTLGEGTGAPADAGVGSLSEVSIDTPGESAAAAELFPASFSERGKKRRGGVYTRRALVDALLQLCAYTGQERVLEPAVGAGAFLHAIWERALDSGARPQDLSGRLHAVDLHPFACRAALAEGARVALRRGLSQDLAPAVQRGDALLPEGDSPCAARGAYDLVLGNPPYVRGERIPSERRAAYRERFPQLGAGNTDLAAYFVAAALEWLREGGRVAYVLSQGLFETRSSAGLRALLAAHCVESVVTLEWAPGAFPDASVIPCLLVVRKGAPPADHCVRLGQARWKGEEREALAIEWNELPQARWLAAALAERWPLFVRHGDLDVLDALRAAPTPLEVSYGLSVRTKVGAKDLIAEGAEPPKRFKHPYPLRDGREVAAWGVEPVARWIDYRPEAISDAKSLAFFAGPKLLVSRIALTPHAAVDESDALCRNTVMVARAPGCDLYAVAALINSLPLRFYAFHLLRAGVLAGSHRCTLYAGVVSAFPIPASLVEAPSEGAAAELARLGRAAALAAAGEDPAALAALESEIDACACEAYGLSKGHVARLHAEAARDPLLTVLRPARLGARRRTIGVQGYSPGGRYR